jgi:hypothetical protein
VGCGICGGCGGLSVRLIAPGEEWCGAKKHQNQAFELGWGLTVAWGDQITSCEGAQRLSSNNLEGGALGVSAY